MTKPIDRRGIFIRALDQGISDSGRATTPRPRSMPRRCWQAAVADGDEVDLTLVCLQLDEESRHAGVILRVVSCAIARTLSHEPERLRIHDEDVEGFAPSREVLESGGDRATTLDQCSEPGPCTPHPAGNTVGRRLVEVAKFFAAHRDLLKESILYKKTVSRASSTLPPRRRRVAQAPMAHGSWPVSPPSAASPLGRVRHPAGRRFAIGARRPGLSPSQVQQPADRVVAPSSVNFPSEVTRFCGRPWHELKSKSP
jgi:hypothetical protein